MRTGLIAKSWVCPAFLKPTELMSRLLFLSVDGLQVVDVKTAERDGYTAVQLGTGAVKAKECIQTSERTFC